MGGFNLHKRLSPADCRDIRSSRAQGETVKSIHERINKGRDPDMVVSKEAVRLVSTGLLDPHKNALSKPKGLWKRKIHGQKSRKREKKAQQPVSAFPASPNGMPDLTLSEMARLAAHYDSLRAQLRDCIDRLAMDVDALLDLQKSLEDIGK